MDMSPWTIRGPEGMAPVWVLVNMPSFDRSAFVRRSFGKAAKLQKKAQNRKGTRPIPFKTGFLKDFPSRFYGTVIPTTCIGARGFNGLESPRAKTGYTH